MRLAIRQVLTRALSGNTRADFLIILRTAKRGIQEKWSYLGHILVMTNFWRKVCLGTVCAGIFSATVGAHVQLTRKTEAATGRLKSGLHVVLHTPDTIPTGANGKRNSVKSLFGDNPSSRWLFRYLSEEDQVYEMGDDRVTLLIKLDDPVIVTGIRLRLCRGQNANKYVDPKKLYIQREQSSVPGFPSNSFYLLSKNRVVQTIKLPKYDRYDWPTLFPTRRVIIHVTDVYGEREKSSIGCLAGIDLTYAPTKTAGYKPKYS